jgi:carotenoid 1,2-hydratase
MLSLTVQRSDLGEVLSSPGGFFWWYADLVDADGRGMVLIWSFGLPFLSGSRDGQPARERPAVSLALYEGGRPVCYLLQTYDPAEVSWQGPSLVRMGGSVFRVDVNAGAASVSATLDMPVVGGGRVRGSFQTRGRTVRLRGGDRAGGSLHQWSPLLAATEGRALLQVDGTPFELNGRAYVDSNASPSPLHTLGIRNWRWGRLPLPGRELIYYLVEPSTAGEPPVELVLSATPDGRVRQHAAQLSWQSARRNLYGLDYHELLELKGDGLDVRLRFTAAVDTGPFYLRFLVEAEDSAGHTCVGIAEQVAPERVDMAWQRPFIRMRTHQTEGSNSMWLPLFSGPSKGRFKRLMDHWLPYRPESEIAP